MVWLDAPCTAYGTGGKHPEVLLTRGQYAKEASEKMAQIQRQLIVNTLPALSSDGIYVYSVCTLTASETVDQKNYLCKVRKKNVRLETAFWPGQNPCPTSEGFYFFCI